MFKVSNSSLRIFLGAFLCVAWGLILPTANANIIDDTYGVGAGSFELGAFVNNGFDYMALAPGATTITAWTVGGPGDGVDWLSTPTFGAQSGLHSIDLIHSTAGSVSTLIPTTLGQTYELSFYAAAISTGVALGTVSAGSLVDQSFTAPITPAVYTDPTRTANQVFALFSFLFTATGPTSTVSFTSAGGGCFPDCYGPVIDSVSVDLVSVPPPSSVPEPSSIALLLLGGGVLCARVRTRRHCGMRNA
jgi:hypothetical protein